jgi:hypothetical protein
MAAHAIRHHKEAKVRRNARSCQSAGQRDNSVFIVTAHQPDALRVSNLKRRRAHDGRMLGGPANLQPMFAGWLPKILFTRPEKRE